MANEHLVFKYGDTELDFSAMPPSTLTAMLRRGVSHLFGSEAASKVQAKIEKVLAGETEESKKAYDALPDDVRRAQIKAFREGRKDDVAAMLAEVTGGFLQAMRDGSLGTSVRGPALDPVEAIERRLVREYIVATLKANSIKIPKKNDEKVIFPNGDQFTLPELIDRFPTRQKAKHEELAQEARRIHAADVKRQKKAAEAPLDL